MDDTITLGPTAIEKIIALHYGVEPSSVEVFIDDKYPHYAPKAKITIARKD